LTTWVGLIAFGLGIYIAFGSIDECLSGGGEAYWGMTKIGFAFLLLIAGSLAFGHGVRRTVYSSIIEDTRALIADMPDEADSSGVVHTVVHLTLAFGIGVAAFLPAAWLGHLYGLPLSIAAWVVFASVMLVMFWRDWKALAALLLINGLAFANIAIGMHGIAVGMGAVQIALFAYGFSVKRLEAKQHRRIKVQVPPSIAELVCDVGSIAKDVRAKAYRRSSVAFAQAVTIFLVVGFYVFAPFLIRLVPPSIVGDGLSGFIAFVEQAKEYAPHVAFSLYLLMSSLGVFGLLWSPVANLLIRKNNPLVFLTLPLLMVFMLSTLLPLGYLLITIAYLLMATGSSLGFAFALLLGFFVFPRWVVHFLSYMAALLLCYYPILGVKRMEVASED